MIALLISNSPDSFEQECALRLPDGNTVLLRELRLLKQCGVSRVILPAAAVNAWSAAASMGFELLPLDARLMKGGLTIRNLKACLSGTVEEDLVVIPQKAVFSASVLRKLTSQTGDGVLVAVSGQDRPSMSSVFLGGRLPLDPDSLNSECEFLPDFEKFPIYRISSGHFRTLKTGEAHLTQYPVMLQQASSEDSDDQISPDEEPEDSDSLRAPAHSEASAENSSLWQLQVINCTSSHLLWTDESSDEDLLKKMLPICLSDLTVWSGADPAFHLRERLSQKLDVYAPVLLFEKGYEASALACWGQKDLSPDMISLSADQTCSADALASLLPSGSVPDGIVALGGIAVQDAAALLRRKLTRAGGHRSVQLIVLPTLSSLTVDRADALHCDSLALFDIANLYVTNLHAGWEQNTNSVEQLRLACFFCLSEAIRLMLEAGTPEDVAKYAATAGNAILNDLFSAQWTSSNDVHLTRSAVYLSAARALSPKSQGDVLSGYLCSELHLAPETASVLATAALVSHYCANNRLSADTRGRRILADALDEVAALLQVGTDELPDVTADLLFWSGWAPDEQTLLPDAAAIDQHLRDAAVPDSALPLTGNLAVENLLPLFREDFSICKTGTDEIERLFAAGYDPRCRLVPLKYSDFINIRRQSAALSAKREIQDTFRSLFHVFHAFCEENHLSYILIGDTLYGANTIGDLLPYSARLEVAMPVADLDRLSSDAGLRQQGICITPQNMSSGVPAGTVKISLADSYWVTKSNLLALQDDKSIGIYVYPLVSALGHNLVEKLRFSSAQKAAFLALHKQGYAHRKVGWKGQLLFQAAKRVPVSSLQRFQEDIGHKEAREGEYFLCNHGMDYDSSLIRKSSVLSARTVPFAGGAARVPADTASFQFDADAAEARIRSKSNYFLLPGSYTVSSQPEHKTYRIAEPPAKLPASTSLQKELEAALKRRYQVVRPKIRSALRTQYVRATGSLRGMGICLTPNSKLLKSYHNRYAGQRCFLIGNGPSLRAEDLDRLQNEVTFGCNFIHKIYNQTDWRPTYHFISDSGTVRTASWDIVRHLDESRTTMFIREYAYKFMYVKPKHAVLVPYISVDDYKVHGNYLAYHYISHATVMSMMIEAAFYMGFQEIYLIGVDGTTSSSKGGNFAKNYFSDAQRAQLDKLKRKAMKNYDVYERRREIQERQNMVYSKLREYAEAHNIKIYNATRGGVLEVFERADLDSVLGLERP